jgi:membrane-bound serine protease (ClpP class)
MNKLLTVAYALVMIAAAHAQEQKVMVMEIKQEIDPRVTRYVKLALDNAREAKADIVIVEMDTYGGVLTDAKEIVDLIMDFDRPIWVYINTDAASAGALISIACDSIYMSPGASIGAATVVGPDGSPAPDKYQSYMRSIMRSTAEENGRDPRIAEGMVDEDIVIDSVKEEGKVITFTTNEAIEYGFCEAKVESIEEILERNRVERYTLERFELGPTERIIAFFLNPFISGLLILIIIGGIYFELQTPGVGFPLIAAVTALVLYLVPYYLNGLAEYWEIIALLVGITLIVLEIFVLPGFGIAGVAGIGLTMGSLILIMLNNDVFNFEFVPMRQIWIAGATSLIAVLGAIFILIAGASRIASSKALHGVALADTQDARQGYTANFFPGPMKGKTGTAFTVLRPSGKVMIEGRVYDAYTRGDYIPKDQPVEVVNDEGSSLQVKSAARQL